MHCSVFSRKLWRDELAQLRRVLPGGRTNSCIIALARMWGSSCIPVYVPALTACRGVTCCPLLLQVASGHFPRSVVFQGAGPIRQSDEAGPAPYPRGTAEPPCCPLPTPPLPLHTPRWRASEPVHSVQGPGAWDPLLSPSGVTKSVASPLKKLGSDSVPLGTSQRRSWEHISGSQICPVLLFL